MLKWNTPFWWYSDKPMAKAMSWVLVPFAHLYAAGANWDQKRKKPYKAGIPVICVGNFTAGGGGKTPTCIYLADKLTEKGHKPGFLTRGYGGNIGGPHLVDLSVDSIEETGDEPRLLAGYLPTVIAADRAAGAKLLEKIGVTHIIMDDGFQNMSLHKDFSIIVTDGVKGLGNEKVIPAGPLRAPLRTQLHRTDILLVLRKGTALDRFKELTQKRRAQLLTGEVLVESRTANWLKGRRVLAFSGIALPEKFYDSLKENGAEIVDTKNFPDHYAYKESDHAVLMDWQKQHADATLVTTSKDAVKLQKMEGVVRTIPVSMHIHDELKFFQLLDMTKATPIFHSGKK